MLPSLACLSCDVGTTDAYFALDDGRNNDDVCSICASPFYFPSNGLDANDQHQYDGKTSLDDRKEYLNSIRQG